jgi:hypothetical protein
VKQPPVDVSPEEAEEISAKARERAWRREMDDLRTVMSTAQGRRVMHKILYDLAGIMKLGWGAEKVNYTDFHAGARNLGLTLFEHLKISCPRQMQEMDAEHELPPTPEP